MSESDNLNAIRLLKKTFENVTVSIGVLIGTILLIYFFTFAVLIDNASTILVWIETITTVVLVLMLVFIKRIGFILTKLLLGRRKNMRSMFTVLSSDDLSLDEQALIAKLGSGTQAE